MISFIKRSKQVRIYIRLILLLHRTKRIHIYESTSVVRPYLCKYNSIIINFIVHESHEYGTDRFQLGGYIRVEAHYRKRNPVIPFHIINNVKTACSGREGRYVHTRINPSVPERHSFRTYISTQRICK